MAKKPPTTDILAGGTAKAIAESKRRFQSDDDHRASSKTLLKPDEVAGEYDISRQLKTTLSPGGKPVKLTHEHLRQFAHNARQATSRIQKKGVTAQTIIDLSMPVDIERARDEIRTAVPVSSFGQQVKFVTDVGPNSKDTRQYVTVNFIGFSQVVASATPVEKTGKLLTGSPLQISCSCGRWRFWLAYLATRAGYNSGHPEDAFPKIRNPGMHGIACKHILRVMGLIRQSPTMRLHLTTMVKKAREKTVVKREDEKVADARAMAAAMRKESRRQRRILTSEERSAESAQRNARRQAAKGDAKAKSIPRERMAKQSKKTTGAHLEAALAKEGMTEEEAIAHLLARIAAR